MTDRELLELAAKVAGVELWPGCNYYAGKGLLCASGRAWWNPLTDDGDALRLAVNRKFKIVYWGDNTVVIFERQESASPICFERLGNDPYAATRRAIVRAAAEIGKEMK